VPVSPPCRYELLNTGTGKTEIKHLTSEEAKREDASHFKDKETGAELEVQDKQPLLEWLANNYKKFGCTLEFVTNKYVFVVLGFIACVCDVTCLDGFAAAAVAEPGCFAMRILQHDPHVHLCLMLMSLLACVILTVTVLLRHDRASSLLSQQLLRLDSLKCCHCHCYMVQAGATAPCRAQRGLWGLSHTTHPSSACRVVGTPS
jgi:hypothetical protein